jgi:hypothetical protein
MVRARLSGLGALTERLLASEDRIEADSLALLDLVSKADRDELAVQEVACGVCRETPQQFS